ncbi:hypothetical protein H5410_035978 [Solanum commersonii]|uniref:ATP-dependent DNA ligase family profile domain-containing protein n=1 Tax=Solanum commersonii TaxID=4109 RepID=A0A9J5Y439_SOLCO|nr:hypothetical protein H5410_035978 [Solanum commersonii]
MLILIGIIGGLFRDEGVVLKDLTSKWEPSDRSGKWLKLKPDYVRPGSDLDVLIIGLYCLPKVSVWLLCQLFSWANFTLSTGGYYGSGRHGGEVAQFLVGLAEPPAPNTYPRSDFDFTTDVLSVLSNKSSALPAECCFFLLR